MAAKPQANSWPGFDALQHPATYGELVRDGNVLPWFRGSSSIEQAAGTN